jgi:hypothetical protein
VSGRGASYLRAVILFVIPSGGKDEASSAVFLVVADLVCILSSRQLAAAGV